MRIPMNVDSHSFLCSFIGMGSGLMNAYSIAQSLVNRNRMVAVLYWKKTIYSVGFDASMPRKQLFNNRIYLPSIHAEVDCLARAYNSYVRINHRPLNADLLVLRHIGSSKPCIDCLRLMRSQCFCIHIRNVTYLEDRNLKTERLSKMETNHRSRGFKLLKPSSASRYVELH